MNRGATATGAFSNQGFAKLVELDQTVLDAIPVALYVCSADGIIRRYNRKATQLWMRTPKAGDKDELYCGSLRLFELSGKALPHANTPMEAALRTGKPQKDKEVVIERPDGSRITALVNIQPLTDEGGNVIGAINSFQDITASKHAEDALAHRMTEQAAIYMMTDRLYHGCSLDDAFAAALDAITSSLRCARASILLFDEDNVMRFVAWRGLSEDYRQAVDGHSPWTAETYDAVPIYVADIAQADLEPGLRATIEKEKIGALAFIPLSSGGRVIGKFMAYYDEPHSFSAEDEALAVTIARQLCFAVQRIRSDEARRAAEMSLRDSEQRLQMALEAGGMGAWEWELPSGKVIWSPTLEAMHGLEPGSFGGTFADFQSDIHPEDAETVGDAIDAAISGGEPYHVTYRATLPDGSRRWLEAFGQRVEDSDGSLRKLIGVCMDVTARKEAETQREILIAELSHRVKNTLATVVSIARQSLSGETDPQKAYRSFEGRIRALAQTHGRLAEAQWSGVSLQTILEDEVAPYLDEKAQNIRLSGPGVSLPPKPALALGMAFHELATNAAKYGPFSVRRGRVEVEWKLSGDQLYINWAEQGGPDVAPPTKTGFGRLLLEKVLADDFNGTVDIRYDPEGVRCTFTIPYDEPCRGRAWGGSAGEGGEK